MALILIVEDELNVRELIADAVTALGHQIRVAATASRALAVAQSVRPDAVLLDMALHDAGGTETLDRLLNLYPHIRVIMVTANADEHLARETLKRGAFDYLMKPFEVKHLETILEAALAS